MQFLQLGENEPFNILFSDLILCTYKKLILGRYDKLLCYLTLQPNPWFIIS